MLDLADRVKRLAAKFVVANYNNPTQIDYLVIENAMLQAATLVVEDSRKQFEEEQHVASIEKFVGGVGTRRQTSI